MSPRRGLGCLFLIVLFLAAGAYAWREARVRAERRLRAELEALERRSGGRQRASYGSLELRPLELGASLKALRYETRGAGGEPLVLEADELRVLRLVPELLGRPSDLEASLLGLRSAWLDRELSRLPGLADRRALPCKLDVRVQLHYDPQEPRPLTLAAQAQAEAVGRLDLRLLTHGLAPGQLESAARLLGDWGRALARGEPSDEHALDALSGAMLVEAEAVFVEGGLAEALLEREARRLGLTREETRDKLRVDLWGRLEPGGVAPPWLRDAGVAAETFVGEPRRLRVRLAPDEPVELQALPAAAARGSQALAELAGFEAAANEAP